MKGSVVAVGQRLSLGLAPALLAVIVVVALAYYGEIGRQAPVYVVAIAAALAVSSMVLTWRNTRYLVARLQRLARDTEESGQGAHSTPHDELDRIEGEVVRLRDALRRSGEQAESERAQAAAWQHEHATLLAATVRGVTAQLDEIRLPLYILLDARFGELNPNQEELLVAARSGAEGLEATIRRLATVADADRGALHVRLEPIAINDVVRAVLPMARASAARRSIQLSVDLEPGLPRAWADRAMLAEAIALLMTHLVERSEHGNTLAIATNHCAEHCVLRIHPVDEQQARSLDVVVDRLFAAQHVEFRVHEGGVELSVPRTARTT